MLYLAIGWENTSQIMLPRLTTKNHTLSGFLQKLLLRRINIKYGKFSNFVFRFPWAKCAKMTILT